MIGKRDAICSTLAMTPALSNKFLYSWRKAATCVGFVRDGALGDMVGANLCLD